MGLRGAGSLQTAPHVYSVGNQRSPLAGHQAEANRSPSSLAVPSCKPAGALPGPISPPLRIQHQCAGGHAGANHGPAQPLQSYCTLLFKNDLYSEAAQEATLRRQERLPGA